MECFLPGGRAAESSIGKAFQTYSSTDKMTYTKGLLTTYNGLEGLLRAVCRANPTEMPDTFGVRHLIKNLRH
jgi:hypothetical protein